MTVDTENSRFSLFKRNPMDIVKAIPVSGDHDKLVEALLKQMLEDKKTVEIIKALSKV